MAKIAFSKFGIKKNDEIKTVTFKDLEIELKEYLPVEEVLSLIETVLNKSVADDSRFFNTVKIDLYLGLEILYRYTNISFTAKQMEDEAKLYDLVKGSGLLNVVLDGMTNTYYELQSYIYDMVSNIYEYQNSILGLLNTMSEDYSNLEFDANKLREDIAAGKNIELLQQIAPMLGLN